MSIPQCIRDVRTTTYDERPNEQRSAAPLAGVWSETRTAWRQPEAMCETPPSAGGKNNWSAQNNEAPGMRQLGKAAALC